MNAQVLLAKMEQLVMILSTSIHALVSLGIREQTVKQVKILNCSGYNKDNAKVEIWAHSSFSNRHEGPSGLYSLRQVTEVKLGRVRSNSGWVTLEA